MATRNAEQVKPEPKVAENGNSPNAVNPKTHGHQGGGGNNPQNNQFRKNDKFGGPGNMSNRGGGGGPMKKTPRMGGDGGGHGGGGGGGGHGGMHGGGGGGHGGGGHGGGPMRRDNTFNQDNKDRKFRPTRFQGNKNNDGGNMGMGMPRNIEDRINERLSGIGGATYDLPAIDMSEKKFSGRNRLYIGNLPADVTEEELVDIFKPYGETSEIFINKEKNFGFIRLDFHANAEKAKREVDGTVRKGRPLKVRFAPNSATIKVKNLTQFVTNELLHMAFSVFGEIERCVVIVDDRGKPTGEGIVEYVRKPSAQLALKNCHEGCFFLTSSLRPVIVELHEQIDDMDGLPEKNLMKKNNDYHQAREMGPRFANTGSFEHEYGTRWKQLHELYKQKEISLKQELQMEQDKLEAQMQFAKFENETEMLREQLRVREMDRERQKREWEERERMAEEQRIRNEEQMRRQQDEMQRRMHHQEEDLRRRQQENTLFMQDNKSMVKSTNIAHQLSNILDQQEQAMQQSYNSPIENMHNEFENAGDSQPMDPQSFLNSYERSHHYEGRGGMGGGDMGGPGGTPRGSGGRGHWGNDNRRDDYPTKRRRY